MADIERYPLGRIAKCDGACETHTEKLKRVHVKHGAKDWGQFNYCDEAIADDMARGFEVTIVEDSQ